jgi:uncharacterized membrane-anchored protein
MKNLSHSDAREMFNKVPEVTMLFWVVKIMATTVGETGADFLIYNLNFGLAATSYLMSSVLALVLFLQIRSREYKPWMYWITVVFISIVGTLITDNLVDNLGVALETTTIVFSVGLVATFAIWYLSERTLSIHTIYTVRRELFYWAAILLTFALGTAAGDLVAESWNLGYATSGVIFASLIGIITTSYYLFKANAVLSFWLAYILTRPLGASLGDYLSQPIANGGMGLGAMDTSIAFLAIITAGIVYWSVSRRAACLADVDEG